MPPFCYIIISKNKFENRKGELQKGKRMKKIIIYTCKHNGKKPYTCYTYEYNSFYCRKCDAWYSQDTDEEQKILDEKAPEYPSMLPKKNEKKKLSRIEHVELANDIAKCSHILTPWLSRLYKAYRKNSKENNDFKKMLRILTSTICCTQDFHFFELPDDQIKQDKSPYYNNGIIHH